MTDWRALIAEHLATHPMVPPPEKDGYWWPLARPSLTANDIAAALDILLSGNTTCWKAVGLFEGAFADRFAPARAAVMVNSGSSANLLAAELLARRIGRGAEVVIPAVTWPTHAWAAIQAGLRVRFSDVDVHRWTATAESVDAAATAATRAVWLVHPLGLVADVVPLRALAAHRGWTVMEDCCDALGAMHGSLPVGARSLAATFSLFYSHALTTMEGGVVVVDREDAPALRAWRSHGWTRDLPRWAGGALLRGAPPGPFVFGDLGWNLRPTEVQGAIGLSQLAHWTSTEARRRALGAWWERIVATVAKAVPEIGLGMPTLTAGDALHGLPFQTPVAERICRALEAAGVETRPILAGDMTTQPAVRALREDGRASWPNSDRADLMYGARSVHMDARYLGLLPTATDAERDRLAETFLTACRGARHESAFSKEVGDA